MSTALQLKETLDKAFYKLNDNKMSIPFAVHDYLITLHLIVGELLRAEAGKRSELRPEPSNE